MANSTVNYFCMSNCTSSLNSDVDLGYQLAKQEQIYDNNGPLFMALMAYDYLITVFKRKAYMYRINDSLTSMFCAFLLQVLQLTTRAVEIEWYWFLYKNYAIIHLPWNSIWTVLLEFFVVDFIFYWFHRASHEVHILWAVHQMHHNSEEYNLCVALRQSIFLHLTKIIFYSPEMLLFPPHLHIIHYTFNLFYQFFLHSPLLSSFGPLDYILNTPTHHRVHHGRNPYCVDKNYGGILIIWDRLFGTFQSERLDEPVSFGLVNNIDKKYVKYYTPVSHWLQFYVMLHGLTVQLMFMKFYYDYKNMDHVIYFFNIIFLVYAINTFSLLIDANRYAYHFELIRLIATFCWFYSYVSTFHIIIRFILYQILITSITISVRKLFISKKCSYTLTVKQILYHYQRMLVRSRK